MILLDTHVWIWWVNADRARLRPSWSTLIQGDGPVAVSAISCFEAAWLSQHGRLRLTRPLAEWFSLALEASNIGLVALSPEIARRAVELPAHHGDPFDRIIIATAVAHDAKLLSADSKFPAYEVLEGRLNP